MPNNNLKGQSYDYAVRLGCQAVFLCPLLLMTLRCGVIDMAPHGATGHGGVQAARALGLCLFVCLFIFVLGCESPTSGNHWAPT